REAKEQGEAQGRRTVREYGASEQDGKPRGDRRRENKKQQAAAGHRLGSQVNGQDILRWRYNVAGGWQAQRDMRPRNSTCQRISSIASGKLPPGPGESAEAGGMRASTDCSGPAALMLNPAFQQRLISPLALRSEIARSTT